MFTSLIFVNQIVCVDAKCSYFAHAMLHLAVIISDMILKCSIRERVIDYISAMSDSVTFNLIKMVNTSVI